MNAWTVHQPGPIESEPLRRVERRAPTPIARQIRVKVSCCGVCRTDLHLAEGDLLPRHPNVTPGHEVVGVVDALGDGVSRFALGDRVGVAWLGGTDGSCRFCRRGAENLCIAPTFTGWDSDGGYADFCLVDEAFGYALPAVSTTSTWLPCCAPASSATGRCSARRFRPAARSVSMASVAAPTSPHRWRWHRACGSTC